MVDLLQREQVVNLMKNEQQSQTFYLKVNSRSTFRNNFLQPATNVLLHDKLIMQGEKCETSTQSLQRNNVARQVEGFLSRILPSLGVTASSILVLLIFAKHISRDFQNIAKFKTCPTPEHLFVEIDNVFQLIEQIDDVTYSV